MPILFWSLWGNWQNRKIRPILPLAFQVKALCNQTPFQNRNQCEFSKPQLLNNNLGELRIWDSECVRLCKVTFFSSRYTSQSSRPSCSKDFTLLQCNPFPLLWFMKTTANKSMLASYFNTFNCCPSNKILLFQAQHHWLWVLLVFCCFQIN